MKFYLCTFIVIFVGNKVFSRLVLEISILNRSLFGIKVNGLELLGIDSLT